MILGPGLTISSTSQNRISSIKRLPESSERSVARPYCRRILVSSERVQELLRAGMSLAGTYGTGHLTGHLGPFPSCAQSSSRTLNAYVQFSGKT